MQPDRFEKLLKIFGPPFIFGFVGAAIYADPLGLAANVASVFLTPLVWCLVLAPIVLLFLLITRVWKWWRMTPQEREHRRECEAILAGKSPRMTQEEIDQFWRDIGKPEMVPLMQMTQKRASRDSSGL
jgi:hypothetical protein